MNEYDLYSDLSRSTLGQFKIMTRIVNNGVVKIILTNTSVVIYQSATTQHSSIFDPPIRRFWWFNDAGSAHSVHGPSLWPARRFGTLYQTAPEIRIMAGTTSDVC